MKVLKVEELDFNNKITNDFIEAIQFIAESGDNKKDFTKYQKKVISDLKLNTKLIGTFGAGIGAFYPVVNSLMENMGLGMELEPETVVLLTICTFTIVFIENGKLENGDEELLSNDSKSMLEELKMKGIGNGIVKKMVKAFNSIFNIFKIIFKHVGKVLNGFVDMFAYTSMLIPVMNAINYIIDKYEFTPESIIQNFIGLGIGISTISAKHIIVDIIDTLKNKVNSGQKEKANKELIDDLTEINLDDIKQISDVLIDQSHK